MTSIRNSIDSSRTINRQQEQEQAYQQEKNVEHQHNPEGDYYYNNYYPARARAYAREATSGTELPPAEIMQQIADAYHDNISDKITKVAAGIIERALTSGMEPATVILAIEETGMASRPSPYYLSAVLRRWAETGVVCSRARGTGQFDISVTQAKPWWR